MSVGVRGVILAFLMGMVLFVPAFVQDGGAADSDDDVFWGSIDCGSEVEVGLYLEAFPKGRHVAAAQACLERIEGKKGRSDQVQEILSECRAHYESNRLTRGSVGNALDCYREVLSLDRGNAEALSGIRRIEGYFVEKAESALQASLPDDALSRIERLEWINPEHPRVDELKRRAADLKAELAKAESVRDVRTAGEIFRDCDVCPEMVVVPAGSYMMGSPLSEVDRDENEGPRHRVTIRQPFAVGRYEVTFREWDACELDGGCAYFPDDESWGRGDRPVIYVSWEDAKEYVAWLSRKTGKLYRLLSEAEWEYVARAGTTGPFHFGSIISTDQVNYDGQYYISNYGQKGVNREQTLPVGSFPANDFGLHDVHGNAAEWVEDCWHRSYDGAPSDGSAWISGDRCWGRVVRGGSFGFDPIWLRSAYRSWHDIGSGLNGIGFRVARMLAP